MGREFISQFFYNIRKKAFGSKRGLAPTGILFGIFSLIPGFRRSCKLNRLVLRERLDWSGSDVQRCPLSKKKS